MPEDKEAQQNKNTTKRSEGKSTLRRVTLAARQESPKFNSMARRELFSEGRILVGDRVEIRWMNVDNAPAKKQESEIKQAIAHVEKVIKRMGVTQRKIDRLKNETRKLIADMKAT